MTNERGLVSLSPLRDRSEVWTIGLQQKPVERGLQNGVIQAPVLEGDHSAEGHIVAEDQGRSQERHAAAEGVQDGGDIRMRRQNGGHILIRLPRVNYRRL